MRTEDAQALQDRISYDLADIDPEDRRLIHALLFAVYHWHSNTPTRKRFPRIPKAALKRTEYEAAWKAAKHIMDQR